MPLGLGISYFEDGRLYPMQGAASYTQLPALPVLAGAVWALQPVVTVLKADGSVDTSYTGPVTIRSPNGALSGTTTVAAVAGVATFVGLSFAAAGTPLLIAEAPQRGVVSTTITVN